MIGTAPLLIASLLSNLSSFACERDRPVSFRVNLMPPCQTEHRHRTATDFMDNAVALEIHSLQRFTINGDSFKGLLWIAVLKDLFSTRVSKTLFILPDGDVRMSQVLTVLEFLNEQPFVNRIVLLTPKQVQDINDESCVADSNIAVGNFGNRRRLHRLHDIRDPEPKYRPTAIYKTAATAATLIQGIRALDLALVSRRIVRYSPYSARLRTRRLGSIPSCAPTHREATWLRV